MGIIECLVLSAVGGSAFILLEAAVKRATRRAAPKELRPIVVPGCSYYLPDGVRVQVCEVNQTRVRYGVKSGYREVIWEMDREEFATIARRCEPSPPLPKAAPAGSVSIPKEGEA